MNTPFPPMTASSDDDSAWMKFNPFLGSGIACTPLPPFGPYLYEVILASNGIFLRAHRDQLQVLFPITHKGDHRIPALETAITLLVPVIPHTLMTAMLKEAMTAWKAPQGPYESLFHFTYREHWHLDIPDQIRTATSVTPRDPANCPSYTSCLVEIHSHHEMAPFFSAGDNRDETGFRIYGVCGDFHQRPRITFRIGVYGHYYDIPASLICDLPPDLHDTYQIPANKDTAS